MARRLTREEGLFVGGSSGLITSIALNVARELDDPNAMVVTILCDTGERYLSKLYSDEWMRENQMLDVPKVLSIASSAERTAVRRRLVSVGPGATVRQAIGLMSLHDVSQLPVMDGVKLCRIGKRLVGFPEESGESQAAGPYGQRNNGFTISDGGVGPAGRQRREAAVESEPRGSRAGARGRPGIVTRSDMLHYMMSR